jgi:flagellar assembly factor FliW
MSQPVAAHDLSAGSTPSEQVVLGGGEGSFLLPEGLLGFEDARRFILAPADREGLYWLQSLDHASLAFLLCDPFHFVEGFVVDLGPRELTGDFGGCREQLAVLTIVTLPRETGVQATANLQGPVLFDFGTGTARQVALADSSWGVRHPVDLRRGRVKPAPMQTGT